MAGFTKVNPVGGIALNTLYSTLQLKAFKLVFSAALVPGLDTYNDDPNKTADLIAQEFGTTGAMFQIAADGEEMVIIGDGHALDAATVKIRAENVVGGTVTVTELTSLAGLLA
jgi:hypothetical protein